MVSQFKKDEIAYELRHEDEKEWKKYMFQSRSRKRRVPQVRQYLNVPFKEKEKAKSMGARWDPSRKSWYVLVFQGQRWEPAGYEHWWK